MAGINSGAQYLKSVPGVLKILEIILLIVCIGSVGYFLDNGGDDDYKKKDNLKLFVGAAAVAGIIALLLFLIFLSGQPRIIHAFSMATIAGVIFIVLGILVLVASGFLADAAKYYEDNNICDILERLNKITKVKSQCKQLIVGIVCGFSAGILFIVDGIVHFKL